MAKREPSNEAILILFFVIVLFFILFTTLVAGCGAPPDPPPDTSSPTTNSPTTNSPTVATTSAPPTTPAPTAPSTASTTSNPPTTSPSTTTTTTSPTTATIPAPDRLASHLFIPVGEGRSVAGLGDLLEVVPYEGDDPFTVVDGDLVAVASGTACLRFAYRDDPDENQVQTLCAVAYDATGYCTGLDRLSLDLERFHDPATGPAGDADLLAAGDGLLYALCRDADGRVLLQPPGWPLPPLYLHIVDALGDGPYSLGDDELDRQRAGVVATADGTEVTPPWIVPVSWEVHTFEFGPVEGPTVGFDPCATSPGCTTEPDVVQPGDILSVGVGLPQGAWDSLEDLHETMADTYVRERIGIPWSEVLERDPAIPPSVLARLVNADLMVQAIPWFDDLHDLRAKAVPVAWSVWQWSVLPLCRPEPENVAECEVLEAAIGAYEADLAQQLIADGHDLWSGVTLDYREDGPQSIAEFQRPHPAAFNGVLARVMANAGVDVPDHAEAMAETVRRLALDLPDDLPVVLMSSGPPITAQTGAAGFCEAEVCPSDFGAAYAQFEAWMLAARELFAPGQLVGVGVALFEGSHLDLRQPVEPFAGFALNRVAETGYDNPTLNPWRAATAALLGDG